METYGFWQDFFQTFRSSSDTIKALWLIMPTIGLVGSLWVILNRPRM